MRTQLPIILSFFALLLSFAALSQNTEPKVTSDDLRIIIGDWEGSITYLDYQSNKPFTMPANLEVKAGKSENQLLLFNIYPNEPKANNTDKIKVTKNGTLLNNTSIKSREVLPTGEVQIRTESEGKDDNKKAVIRNTYILGKDVFTIRKEVQFENSTEWIKRNEFNYNRKQ